MIVTLLIYIFTVLWLTVIHRSAGFHTAQLELFWSYRKWFTGDTELGEEIMANIAMFVPLGFLSGVLLTSWFSKSGKAGKAIESTTGRKSGSKIRWMYVVLLVAVLFSLIIETLQLLWLRGLFEWDDVFSNTLGAGLGVLLFVIIDKLVAEEQKAKTIILTSSVIMASCLVVYFNGRGDVEADTTSRVYCFQIDEAEVEDGRIEFSGFAFRYEKETADITLYLRDVESGKRTRLETEYGLERQEVNDYFSCDYDYTEVGFTASGEIEEEAEYEVLIRWPWTLPLSTGVFINSSGMRYQENFTAPDMTAEYVANGDCLVYRPDYHCWVYQYRNDLYWIADDEFNFEDDGSTYIQYQLWTTQIDKLPAERLENEWFWDNIGGYFEDYEIEGYEPYRVMRRELPTTYSIISIVTGYYKHKEWIWKEYFRPVYELVEVGRR